MTTSGQVSDTARMHGMNRYLTARTGAVLLTAGHILLLITGILGFTSAATGASTNVSPQQAVAMYLVYGALLSLVPVLALYARPRSSRRFLVALFAVSTITLPTILVGAVMGMNNGVTPAAFALWAAGAAIRRKARRRAGVHARKIPVETSGATSRKDSKRLVSVYSRAVCAVAGHAWVRVPGGRRCLRSGCQGRTFTRMTGEQ